jgi:signal transduction histidine kinase
MPDGDHQRDTLHTARPQSGRSFPVLNLQSLRVQMALGSALVALVAIFLVAGFTLLAVGSAFKTYQREQLAGEVSRIATALGQERTFTVIASADPFSARTLGTNNVWVMDTSGRLMITPAVAASDQDVAEVTAALRRALSGQTIEGMLPDRAIPGLSVRLYAAAPIHLGGSESGPIVGGVALSTPRQADRAAIFGGVVSRFVLLLALGVAALAAAAAALFSRRLTRPLARLTAATARMAGGAYDARVAIASPEELHSLADSFNGMAAALERDVAELHRQELLRRELVANVSHDLATPLTAIQGFTEALLDGVVSEPEERTETMRLVAREAARLRRLVDQLRQVALFEAAAHTLDRTAVHLPTLIEETLAVLAPEMERKHITVVDELPAELPIVLADPDRLTEILLNLLDNALRQTPEHGRIEVSGVVDGRFVRASIADTGPGIAAADRSHVFERFYRADASRNSTTGGSGLGLAIVRALVEAQGGTIGVDERPGGGARFTFTLPVAG